MSFHPIGKEKEKGGGRGRGWGDGRGEGEPLFNSHGKANDELKRFSDGETISWSVKQMLTLISMTKEKTSETNQYSYPGLGKEKVSGILQ